MSLGILDGNGSAATLKTTLDGGEHVSHHVIDSGSVGVDPKDTGGSSLYTAVSTASTNAASIKGSAGRVLSVVIGNSSASNGFVKLFNKSSAPTPGSDSAAMNLYAKAGETVVWSSPVGVEFTAGIGIAITGAVALNDSTNAAASIAVNVEYA